MASNKDISKLTASVSAVVKVSDIQIKALREFERIMRLSIAGAIEQLSLTKISAAATLARRSPPRRPKKIRVVRKAAK